MNVPQRHFGDLSVELTVPTTNHPLPVLYGAAIGFIDRCYVLIDKPDPEHFRVTLAAKSSVLDTQALHHLADVFERKLAASDLYHRVAEDNRVLTEAVTAQAFGGRSTPSAPRPSLDDLAQFDFSDDAFDDPLGIAQTWEAKHGRPPATPPGDEDPQS